jgi:hypothetical protein
MFQVYSAIGGIVKTVQCIELLVWWSFEVENESTDSNGLHILITSQEQTNEKSHPTGRWG